MCSWLRKAPWYVMIKSCQFWRCMGCNALELMDQPASTYHLLVPWTIVCRRFLDVDSIKCLSIAWHVVSCQASQRSSSTKQLWTKIDCNIQTPVTPCKRKSRKTMHSKKIMSWMQWNWYHMFPAWVLPSSSMSSSTNKPRTFWNWSVKEKTTAHRHFPSESLRWSANCFWTLSTEASAVFQSETLSAFCSVKAHRTFVPAKAVVILLPHSKTLT